MAVNAKTRNIHKFKIQDKTIANATTIFFIPTYENELKKLQTS